MNKYDLIKFLVNSNKDDVSLEEIEECFSKASGYDVSDAVIESSAFGKRGHLNNYYRTVLLSPMYVNDKKKVLSRKLNKVDTFVYRDPLYKEVCGGKMTYVDYLKQRPGVLRRMRLKELHNLLAYRGDIFYRRNLNLNVLLKDKTHQEYIENFVKFTEDCLKFVAHGDNLMQRAFICYVALLASNESLSYKDKIILFIRALTPVEETDYCRKYGLVGEPYRRFKDLLSGLSNSEALIYLTHLHHEYALPNFGDEILKDVMTFVNSREIVFNLKGSTRNSKVWEQYFQLINGGIYS